ncbi:hypothetical protein PV355_01415 [Streptomyces stelliscabiei]|uniref:hypothetical protein n=1 Tax=Streptomyces stelliscabiei TaxID=146820 RepID=UPI0029B6F236|nr:hypothetical protein [Streptomyces stelliscabiei]MDX2513824.1 hypothetical protein [Streptomyces stelliscabiei]
MPGGLAARVWGWQRRMANLPGPLRASGEASNGEPVVVELWVDGVWIDISSYTLVRDDSGSIRLTKGIRGEGSQTDHATSDPQLRNTDGRFSPRNPVGPYFELIGRNTPIRYSVPDGNGGKSYRLWGEVSDWAQNWERSGNDVWTEVDVSGIIRRLAQGPAPERSVIYRAITDPPLTGLIAYWPCEDPAGSTRLASALTSGSPMTIVGSPELAAYDGFGASDPLPTLTGASLKGGVARYDTSSVTQYQMRFLLAVPAAGFDDLDVISRLQVAEVGAGVSLLNYFDINYNDPPGGLGAFGGPGTLTLQVLDGDEATFGSTASISMDVRGRLLRVSLENSISGTTITSTLRVLDINSGVTDSASITITSTSMSRVLSMTLAPDTLAGDAGVLGAAAGHLLLQNTITDIDDLGRAVQPTGEAAGRRIQRLCSEEAIPFQWVGDLDDTVAMGTQGKESPLTLIRECVEADGGMLYETTTALGLGYRTRASLYNQDPAVVLDYEGYNLAQVPVPVEDDQRIANRVTVTVNGVSQTYEETEGRLSTALPPAGVGVYGPSDVGLNLATTDAGTLLDQAAWRVHLGTVDEARHPQISVNLAHSSFVDNPALKRAVLALRQGDRIQVTNPPAWLPPDTIDQLVLGMEETLTHFEHRITFLCAPASPYTVGVLDDDDARIDTDGSELVAAVDSSATSLVVAPSAGESTLWVTDAAEFPFGVRVGGEVMTVTGVTDWLADTFTRSVSNSWGTPDAGGAWSTVGGGAASDYSVNGNAGVHVLSTVDITRRTAVTAASPDFDLYCDITTSALATGASLYGAVTGRMQDSGTMYMARLEFTTSNTILLALRRLVADVGVDLGAYTVPVTHVAGTYIRVRLQGIGPALKAKAWAAADLVEPDVWNVSVTDSAISQAHSIGTRSITVTGNTNVNPQIRYDNYRVVRPQTFTVTRSVNGVVKSHAAGADLRLATPTILAL